MKTSKLTGILILVFLTTIAMSTSILAKKGGKPDGGGGGTDTGLVEMRATGADILLNEFVVSAFQSCEERLASDDTSYLCNKSGNGHDIMLGDFWFNYSYTNGSIGEKCFGTGFDPRVSIGVDKNKDGTAETVFRFHGFKNDGATDVLYVLIVNDPLGWSGPFPPAVGKTTTMGVLQGQSVSWELRTSNKSQARGACVASGTFVNGSDFIKVDFKRID